MANYFARKAGNINAADVWAATPTGTASDVWSTFTTADVLHSNNFAITVNVSTTVGEVRNDNANNATAGGSFTLQNEITLTANTFAGSTGTACVIYSGTSGNSASIVGNCNGGTTTIAFGASNTSTGILNITGNCAGGTATSAHGSTNTSTGILNVTGNCTGGGNTAHGANNNSTGVLNVTGNCTGGSSATAFGANNASTGTMLVVGTIQASEFTGGVGGANRQQTTLLTGPFLISPIYGVSPISSLTWRWAIALNNQTYIEVPTNDLLDKRNLVTPDNATNFPTASDVRSGTAYGIGGVVTGTCVVPNPAQVAAGTPGDDTVGTLAAASASDIATAVWGAATRTITGGVVDTLTNAPASVTPSDIWSHTTRTITGGTVDTLTNAPTVPSASAIADEVRVELATELARIDAPISGAGNAPSASTVATAVRTELTTELGRIDAAVSSRAVAGDIPASDITAIKAKTDALNTERLANVATTAIVGNLIAQANS